MDEPVDGPPVTLAVLSYMQERFIGEAVTSALAQTYRNIDFIFSDDSSGDATLENMRLACHNHLRSSRVQVRKTQRNLGFAQHINEIVALSATPFIVICAGDDVLEPNKVSLLLAPMLADPTVVGVHSAVTEISPAGETLKIRQCAFGERLNDFRFVVENTASVVIQSHACRSEVFARFPPFQPALTNEGIPITARESLLGKIAYLKQPLTRYRLGGTSTQRDVPASVRQIDEPIKITNWGLSGLRQIQLDLDETRWPIQFEVREALKARIEFYSRLQRINSEPFAVGSLVNILRKHSGRLLALRAFARRNLPPGIYRFVVNQMRVGT